MSTVLQLKRNKNDEVVFAQKLDYYLVYKKDDIFNYQERLFAVLDDEAKNIFKKMGLEIGFYRVENTWIDYDDTGEMLYIEMYLIQN